MSIDFSTLQGLSIPEGEVVKIEDAAGNVLWEVQSDKPVILEVEKITSDTYAGETTYTGEEFILLDIYPKTNGTVTVTYGGLTKTITDTSGAEEPNAQQVFFGTFNGVSDEVDTPASGTLTIEGACAGFAAGCYAKSSKSSNNFCGCITAVTDCGSINKIQSRAFSDCNKINRITIPDSVTTVKNTAFTNCTGLTTLVIGKKVSVIASHGAVIYFGGDTHTFYGCTSLTNIIVDSDNAYFSAENGVLYNKTKSVLCVYPSASGHYTIPDTVETIDNAAFSYLAGLTSVTIPSGVTTIGTYAFAYCTGLTSVTIPSGVTAIKKGAFADCTGLTGVTFDNTSGWYVTQTANGDLSTGTAIDVSDPAQNASYLNNTYKDYNWYRS